MTAGTVPLNREQRRKAGMPKLAPDNAVFTLALLQRVERTGPDGVTIAVSLFGLVAPNGKRLMEETPDGPMPVVIASVPQPIKRGLARV